MKKISLFKSIFYSNTFKQSGVTLFGTFLNGIIGVVFYIYVARLLGPKDYGIFSFVTVAVALLASIANAGTDTGVVRFVAESWSNNKSRALRFLSAGLYSKLISFFILLVGGLLLSSFISEFILSKAELETPLRWALLGVGGSMLFSFGCAALQSLQKFWGWSFVNVFGNTLRLVVFFVLTAAGISPALAAVSLFVLSPFVAFGATLVLLPRFVGLSVQKKEWHELVHFNKWVAATTVIVAVSSRLDTLYSTRFLSIEEIGYYSVATSLVGFISQIVLALGSVAAPKFASFNTHAQAFVYLKKFFTFVLALTVIGVPFGILLSWYIVPVVYGSAYYPSVPPLVVLICAYGLFLLSMPIHTMILYFLGNSRFFLWLAIVHLITILICGFVLIPEYKIMGAAYTVLAGMIVNLIIPVIYVLRNKK